MFWRVSTLILFGSIAGSLGYWAQDRSPPIVIEDVEIVTPEVPPGGELKVKYVVNRVRACATRVQKMLTDVSGKYETSDDMEILAALRPLGRDAYISSTIVPKNFERGWASYRSARKYECNPIHSLFWPIVVLVADERFMVAGESVKEPIEVYPRR